MIYGLIDVGNSAIKAQVTRDDDVLFTCQISNHDSALDLFFNQLQVDVFLVSSVVPSVNERLKSICKKRLILINHTHFLGDLTIHVDPINSVGIDRLVNALAATHRWASDVAIIDIGTCMTLCHVTANGDYMGGVIMPGFEMIRDALYYGAEQLPEVSVPLTPPALIGQSTEGAMQSGLFFGMMSMINGMIRYIRDAHPSIKVVVTGGFPAAFLSLINYDEWVPDLQFDGLKRLAKRVDVVAPPVFLEG